MSFTTGTATSASDLITAVNNACVAAGWTSSGSVLHKGSAFHRLTVLSTTRVVVTSGTGIDGSNNLTGIADDHAAAMGRSSNTVAFAYPVTYFIHVNANPDEVYIVVRYAATHYQFVAFGVSAMPGLTGTGAWSAGSCNDYFVTDTAVDQTAFTNQATKSPEYSVACGLFCGIQYYGLRQVGVVDHGLDSATWKIEGAWRDLIDPFVLQPNTLTQKSILIPVRVYAPRTSGFVSPVLECAHARFVNMTNLAPEQIITLGTDRWRVYPVYTKDASQDGGYFAHALRYDGP